MVSCTASRWAWRLRSAVRCHTGLTTTTVLCGAVPRSATVYSVDVIHYEHRELVESWWYGVVLLFFLLRRLMPLLHLCADASVERKREEGGFMLYRADRAAQQRIVVPSVDTNHVAMRLAPGLTLRFT